MNKEGFIHIVFCVNDDYVQYICVIIKSILTNNSTPIHFHILTDEISTKSNKRLNSLFSKKDNKLNLSIHLIDDSSLHNLKDGGFSKYAWYRILIPEILSEVSFALYLDADTLVLEDLSPLLRLEMNNKSIAGVVDIGEENHNERFNGIIQPPFINSGVLWMNLEYWRAHNLTEKIIIWAQATEDKFLFPDQDAINYVCQSSKVILPIKYGLIPSILTKKYFLDTYTKELIEAYYKPIIIHYAGKHMQPWRACSEYYNVTLWREYNRKLKYPAKLVYEGNLLTRFKVWLWNKKYGRTTSMNNLVKRNVQRVQSKKLLKMKQDTFHIAFCINDKYVNYVGVTICSIIVNNNFPIHIHILTDDISSESEERLMTVIRRFSNQINLTIHRINDSSLNGLPTGFWTKYTWYRIFLPSILKDIDKILYLDADTLVIGDLSKLSSIDMTNKSVAGILEDGNIRHKKRLGMTNEMPYFCAGVIMMNLDFWRTNDITEKIICWARENNSILELPDQDSINYVCRNSSFLLPFIYGVTPALYYNKQIMDEHKTELKKAFESPVIIHYAGWRQQPWFNSCTHYAKDIWWDYQRKSKLKIKKIYEEQGLRQLKIRLWVWFKNPVSRHRENIILKLNG